MTHTPLKKYTQEVSRRPWAPSDKGTPVDPERCLAVTTTDNGRAPASYNQCKRPQSGETRPAVADRMSADRAVEDIPVCKFHASYHDRTVKKAEEADRARQDAEDARKAAQEACDRLKKEWDIDARPYVRYDHRTLGKPTGEIVVDPADIIPYLEDA